MLSVLLESRRARRRGWRGVAVSVVAHVLLIGGAVYGTAVATEPPAPPEVIHPIDVPIPPTDGDPPVRGASHTGGARTSAPDDPAIPSTPAIPVIDVPPVAEPSFSIDSMLAHPALPSQRPTGSGAGTGTEGARGERGVFDPSGVDVLAEALPGNPRPDYPSALRAAGVTGVVTARFVIDSTGRVEPRSIAFDGDPNALFAAAVRRALLRSRFRPAEVRGRAVSVLAREDFLFSLE